MSGGSKASPGYQPSGQPAADISYQSLLSNMQPYAMNLPGQVIPAEMQAASNIANNPYAAAQQAGANQVGAMATGTIAPMDYAAAQSLTAFGNAGAPYGSAILQQGFDPQKALYNQQYQQMLDQTNAINAMSGVSGSPYGAGVANQASTNFNIDWQASQLARELAAIQGYGGLGSAVQNAYTGASNLGNQGLQTANMGYNLPYSTYMGNQGNIMNAYNTAAGGAATALQPSSTMMADLATYLGLGQNATANQQRAAQINNAQQNSMWSGLGSLLGMGLGAAFTPIAPTSFVGGL